MKLTQKVFAQSVREHPTKGSILDFKTKNLTSISNLSQFVPAQKVLEIDLTENYIKFIEPITNECQQLLKLNLSLNHVREIENLGGCSKLLYLNLSTNRIQYIGNLENLQSLIFLDLSMNYIEKLENLHLPNLECLKLNGNEIKYIENIQELRKLKQLEISKNKLQSLGQLGLPPQFQDLQIIKVMYNEIPLEYLDDLCLSLQNLPSLQELDCTGNEVTLHRFYKFKLVSTHQLAIIDQVEVKPYLKDHIKVASLFFEFFQKLKNEEDFQELMEGTENEYFERMKEEQKIKNSLKDMIRKQEKQVDVMFEDYQKEMGTDLNDFIEFMQFYQNKKRSGQLVDIQSKELDKWRSKLVVAEQERLRLIDLAQSKQKEVEKNYLESKIATTKLADKLYEISMKEPDVWKDLKARELAQQIQEEQEMVGGDSNVYNNFGEQEKMDPWNFSGIQKNQQNQFQNSLNRDIKGMQGSQLQMEKEMAIKQIQSKIKPFKENPKEKTVNLRNKEKSSVMSNQFDPLVHYEGEQQQIQESAVSGNQRNNSKTKKDSQKTESKGDLKSSGLGKKKKKKASKEKKNLEMSADGSRPSTNEAASIANSQREIQNESQLQQKVLAQRSELVRMEKSYQQQQLNKNKQKEMFINPDIVQERINYLMEQENGNKEDKNQRDKPNQKVNEPNGKTAACLIF